LNAANAIGDGPLRRRHQDGQRRHVLMEVNDNPNIDRGVSTVLGNELYDRS